MNRTRIAQFLLVTFSLAGCGSGGASDDCERIADAYASSRQRCKVSSYDDAKKAISDALNCGSVKSSNGSKVQTCVDDLNALACTAVSSGTLPASCSDALSN